MLAVVGAVACNNSGGVPTITGDWEVYLASGSNERAGFVGWRRMGFAHFANADSGRPGSIRRRTGEAILEVTLV